MENAITLANQVFIMFLIMLIGFILYRRKIVAERTADDMTTVLLYIVTPALILKTYQKAYVAEDAKKLLSALLLAVIAMCFGILVSFLARIGSKKENADVEQFAACFPNNGFMGIPHPELRHVGRGVSAHEGAGVGHAVCLCVRAGGRNSLPYHLHACDLHVLALGARLVRRADADGSRAAVGVQHAHAILEPRAFDG